MLDKHKWSSGRIVACHAIDPGSIPGLCIGFFLWLLGLNIQTSIKNFFIIKIK